MAHTQKHKHTHTHTHTKSLSVSLWDSSDEASDPSRDLYLTTHNFPERQTTLSLAELESTIPASEQPQTYALDYVATGIG
jgi:hypothetical protein